MESQPTRLFSFVRDIPSLTEFQDHRVFDGACSSSDAKKCTYFFVSQIIQILIRLLQNPLLPVTVQDQIRLWELEKNRLKSQDGMPSLFLLSHLHTHEQFLRLPIHRFRVSV